MCEMYCKNKWLYLTLCSFLFLIVFILLLWLFCLLARSWTIATLLTYTVRNQKHIKWVDCKVYNAQWNTNCINLKTHTYNTITMNLQVSNNKGNLINSTDLITSNKWIALLSLLQKEEMTNPMWHNTWSSTLNLKRYTVAQLVKALP
jgi:hypothetical protein